LGRSAVAFRNYKPQGDELKTLEKPTVEVTTVEQEAEKIAPSREELTKAREVVRRSVIACRA